MKKITIVTPCFNEEENVEEIYGAVKKELEKLPSYDREHIFIDNASTDRTVSLLRKIAAKDKKVKVIINARNFGPVRSPFYGLLQSTGDATILIVADFQEPPELIPKFIKKWEKGYKIVLGVKPENHKKTLFFQLRKLYYAMLSKISSVKLIKNTTAFGLYDKTIIEIFRNIQDPYPYLRGLVTELGYDVATINYVQAERRRGIGKSNFLILYDWFWLGVTSYSKIPLMLATILGFSLAALSLIIAIGYLIAKIIFWNSFAMGVAPLVFGLFFFASVQLFFIGVVGEYVGAIYTQVKDRPLVIEKERINFG